MERENCRKRVARAFDIKSSGGSDNEAIWTLPASADLEKLRKPLAGSTW